MLVKALNLILLLTVAVIPLLPASFGFGYELIKILAFILLTIISGLIFVFLLFKKKIKIVSSKIKTASVFFLIVLSLTSLIGINPQESFTGKFPYYQGVIVYWLLFLFFLMISSIRLDSNMLVKTVSFSAVFVSMVSITQFIELNILKIGILNYAGRVISTFGQPNLYSGFLLLTLPFISQLKSGKIPVILIVSLGIILSFSKAAIILLALLGLILLFKKFTQKSLIIFLLIFLFINAVTFSLETSSGLIWDEVLRPLTKQGTEGHLVEKRIYIYPVILEIFSKNPVFGYGIDAINVLYKEHFSDFKPELKNYPPLYFNLMNLTIDRSHNYFLDLLIFSGIAGLASYIFLIYLLFKNSPPLYLKIFLIIYLIWIQFQVQSVAHLMLFWLVAGVILSNEKPRMLIRG